jgi:hypothetical protein
LDSIFKGSIPTGYQLSEGSPNPFRDSVTFSFTIPFNGAKDPIRLVALDRSQRIVCTLFDSAEPTAGTYIVTWHGIDEDNMKLPSDFYYIELSGFYNTYPVLKRSIIFKENE